MPRFSKLRIGALDELARQLRFAPAATLRRQMERAETLVGEVDPAIAYPEDWIVFRITGYRPELKDPGAFPGAALLADISAFVERLSAAARIKESDLDGGSYLDFASVCSRWKVSRKTVERWRRMGLVAIRVRGVKGRPKLLFPAAAVTRFEVVHAARVREAGGFSRMGASVEERVLRRAAVYARLGCTLNQAAGRIARRYGRARETVRQMLKRKAGKEFNLRGPPAPRERELIERAYWWGLEPGEVAQRLSRSTASVHRVINDARAARLHELELATHGGRVPESALKVEAVVSGLGAPGERDLAELVRRAREGGVALGVVERSLAQGYHALLSRAAAAIGGLPVHGAGARVLDRIETDLRWAARLKAELIRSQLPLMVRTLEGAIGRPLEEVRSGLLVPLVKEAIAALAEAVDAFEPGKGGRLAAPSGLALTRVGARFAREHEPEGGAARARARVSEGTVIADWTLSIAPWQRHGPRLWLEPRVRSENEVLQRRYGWGGAPQTIAQTAAAMGLTVMRAAQRERAAVRRARGAAK